MTDTAARKREIRRRVMALRDSMPMEDRRRASILLTERILGHQWFYRAENLLCFASFGSEADTSGIIREALRKGKKVYLPKIEKNGRDMEFYRITSLEALSEGYRGIREPSGDTERYVCPKREAENTLMIMPGVAFDPYRRRLGYGKGFYDRYLADQEALQHHTIAVGYVCQMVEELPQEENDIRPYQIMVR